MGTFVPRGKNFPCRTILGLARRCKPTPKARKMYERVCLQGRILVGAGGGGKWDGLNLTRCCMRRLTKQANRRRAARAKPRTRDVRVERQVRRHNPTKWKDRAGLSGTSPESA